MRVPPWNDQAVFNQRSGISKYLFVAQTRFFGARCYEFIATLGTMNCGSSNILAKRDGLCFLERWKKQTPLGLGYARCVDIHGQIFFKWIDTFKWWFGKGDDPCEIHGIILGILPFNFGEDTDTVATGLKDCPGVWFVFEISSSFPWSFRTYISSWYPKQQFFQLDDEPNLYSGKSLFHQTSI